ncbi:MAG: hypothetical protein [Caudoviricetes sp.]|nr:MAG: hypothetical protein [Caudoviricetes sp.]
MKKKILLFLGLVSLCSLTGCNQSKETKYTEEAKEQMTTAYGMPQLSNYFEYAQLKEIYEKRDDPNLICYWYTKNDMSGKWVYQGKCIGYGIPYGASITSPTSIQWGGKVVGYNQLPLAEPNGLYTDSLSTSATWILSTDKNGNIEPVYVESEITISQSPLRDCLVEEWSENPSK